MNLQKYNKLIASVVVPAIVWAADAAGYSLPEDFDIQLTGVLTALAVFAVPNKVD